MRRHRMLLGSSVILVCAALAGCAGATPPAPTSAGDGSETFPDFPTANASAGDPFDTVPPDPTVAPSDTTPAEFGCGVTPQLVLVGQPYTLTVFEGPARWYGKDRYYQITGLPSGYHELKTADGGEGFRMVLTENAPDLPGTRWTVSVFMRDWDIHDFHPGPVLPTAVRPASTHHEGHCGQELVIGP